MEQEVRGNIHKRATPNSPESSDVACPEEQPEPE